MNKLICSNDITMSSIEIAELVGKRHDNVKRTIENLAAGLIVHPQSEDEWSTDKNDRPRATRIYKVSKRDSFVIVAQLSPEFTARLVDRWQELESLQTPSLPKTFADALRLAADQQEQIDLQREQLAIAAPKVEFVARYVESTGLKGFRQVAKLLGAKENALREFMVEQRIQYRLGGEWCAYQNHIDAGRFEVRTGTSQHSDHVFTGPKFTPKGVQWIAGLWAQHLVSLK